MGRIKTLLIKRITNELIRIHGDKLSDNFQNNKQIVNKLVTTPSKKLKNIIAGYATRLMKKNKEI